MQIRKAVITAAGRGVRLYPAADSVQKAMLPFIDRDGLNKPAIQIIAEEALDSGIEEVCVVCAPGDEQRYRDGFEMLRRNLTEAHRGTEWAGKQAERIANLLRRLHFAVQAEAGGYGDAVAQARVFTGGEPFLLLLGDHLYVSNLSGKRCAEQLIEVAIRESCAVSAVHATREHLVGHYGTVGGVRVPGSQGLYQVERILEKPSLSQAEVEAAGRRIAGRPLPVFLRDARPARPQSSRSSPGMPPRPMRPRPAAADARAGKTGAQREASRP